MRLDNTDPDQKLDELLTAWTVQEPLPPRFGERVWERVAWQEERGTIRLLARLSDWMGRVLARPSVAVSYVTLLLTAGLVAGFWQARSTESRTEEKLGSRYVQSVDPYQIQSPSR